MSLPHVPMMAIVGKGPQHLHLLCCPRLPSFPLAIPSYSCLALDLTIHLSTCHVKGVANLQFPWDSHSQSSSSHISVLPHIGHPAGDVRSSQWVLRLVQFVQVSFPREVGPPLTLIFGMSAEAALLARGLVGKDPVLSQMPGQPGSPAGHWRPRVPL